MILVGVAMIVAISVVIVSSPQGAFSLINQFQMFVLLPMIGAYMPIDVIDVITGMDFTMFSFDFIPLVKIPFLTQMIDLIDYNQSNSYYQTIGLSSGSSLVNHLGVILVVLILLLVHLAILP